MELGDEQKILSKGKAVDVPIVAADIRVRRDATVTYLLYDVDLVLGVEWLPVVNPLIDWP